MKAIITWVFTALFLTIGFAEPGLADGDKESPSKKNSAIISEDTTFVDFTETVIQGKIKAPSGFFLQGRKSQALKQMVRLRSSFRSELRNSKSAVKSIVK